MQRFRRAPSVPRRGRPVLPDLTGIFQQHAAGADLTPLLLQGDARRVLAQLPEHSIDCVMTSPPYWGKREYARGGIGLERDYRDFVRSSRRRCFSRCGAS